MEEQTAFQDWDRLLVIFKHLQCEKVDIHVFVLLLPKHHDSSKYSSFLGGIHYYPN